MDNGKFNYLWQINFTFSKGSDKTRTIHTKSNNIEIMMDNKTDEIIKELFEKISITKIPRMIRRKMRENEFLFDNIDLVHHNLHKTSLNGAGSYIDSPKWLKNWKATINAKNNENKYFQYALTAALNY